MKNPSILKLFESLFPLFSLADMTLSALLIGKDNIVEHDRFVRSICADYSAEANTRSMILMFNGTQPKDLPTIFQYVNEKVCCAYPTLGSFSFFMSIVS